MTTVQMAATTVLADGNGPEFGKSSPLGLLMILLLLVAAALLTWSMSKHLKKIPKSFDNDEDSETGGDAEADDDTKS